MPTRADRLRNAVPRAVLASPLHRLLSGRYLLLEFTGRRTGRRYRTPVAYRRAPAGLLISTDSPWWRNVTGGRAVRVRLAGRELAGTGHLIADPAEALAALTELLTIPGYARAAGLTSVGGRVPTAVVADALTERRVLRIELAGRS